MASIAEEPIRQQVRRGMDEMQGVREDLSELAKGLGELAQKEAELARAEVNRQVPMGIGAAAFASVAAASGLVALIFFGLAGMWALAEVLDLWASALIVAGVFTGLMIWAVAMAWLFFKAIDPPRRTIQSVREDLKWARHQLSFNGR